MRIWFEQKKPGRKEQKIEAVALEIDVNPNTVTDLIETVVRTSVNEFNMRKRSTDSGNSETGEPMTEETIADLAYSGRVSFGFSIDDRTADPEKAVITALQSYEDGLFLLFLNGERLGNQEDKIEIKEGDTLTCVRLTLLSGSMGFY